MHRLALLVIALVPVFLVGTSPLAAQTLPSNASDIATTIPGDATWSDIHIFTLGDHTYADVSYERTEPIQFSDTFSSNGPREYEVLYGKDEAGWHRLTDNYSLALALFGADAIGPVREGQPDPLAATVPSQIIPIPRPDGEQGDTPDLIEMELGYINGPTGLQKLYPSVVLLAPDGSRLRTVYGTQFTARGSIRSIIRDSGELTILAPGDLGIEPLCCPEGTELVRLVWDGSAFDEVERCLRPGTDVQSCGPTSSPADQQTGIIEGSVSYPADSLGLLHSLQVCAYDLDSPQRYCTTDLIDDSSFQFGVGYRLSLPEGTYLVAASPTLGPRAGALAYYTQYVQCGLTPSCSSHLPVGVPVVAGQTLTGIDPSDWWYLGQ